jgi:hypothetical protein
MTTEEVIEQSTIDGNVLKLPDVQLDRKQYMEVKNKLELIGGKWKGGKIGGFVFDEDPTPYIKDIIGGEKRNLKKEYQFFETPDDLADYLVLLAGINNGDNVLEPSAGRGSIIKAIHRLFPDMVVDCFEIMDLNNKFLEKLPCTFRIGNDFLLLKDSDNFYDRIIANPPFSKNQDIDHVRKMYEVMKPGGRIVSIMSNHWTFAGGRKEAEFRMWLSDIEAEIQGIDPGRFKESGTMVGGKIVIINK